MTALLRSWRELHLTEASSPSARGWAHSGLVSTENGDLYTFDPLRSEILRVDESGRRTTAFSVDAVEGHGLAYVREAGGSLWIADCGSKNIELKPGSYRPVSSSNPVHGAVLQVTLSGNEIHRLATPPLALYRTGPYSPTAVVVDEIQDGGSGDVWVADGYGQDLLHRYSRDGQYITSLDGTEGIGRFDNPHSLHIDRRNETGELYVADRGNHRICVFDLEGRFRRVIGVGTLQRPSGMATRGTELFVADLTGRLSVLDQADQLVCHLGPSTLDEQQRPGWPNRLDENGLSTRPTFRDGVFNSPHDVTVTAVGHVAVCEWVIGGRLVVFEPPT